MGAGLFARWVISASPNLIWVLATIRRRISGRIRFFPHGQLEQMFWCQTFTTLGPIDSNMLEWDVKLISVITFTISNYIHCRCLPTKNTPIHIYLDAQAVGTVHLLHYLILFKSCGNRCLHPMHSKKRCENINFQVKHLKDTHRLALMCATYEHTYRPGWPHLSRKNMFSTLFFYSAHKMSK